MKARKINSEPKLRCSGITFLCWIGGLLALMLPTLLRAQQTPNRVLRLNDGNSFVELPPNIFDSLTQATVEGWVLWERRRSTDRFFDFGDRGYEMYVRSDGPQLNFLITEPGGTRHRIEVAGILTASEWGHIAAVSGPGGAKLYFNGALAGSDAWPGSFSGLDGRGNFLGRSNFRAADPALRGAMDEVRVWNHQRTAEQIRTHMFRTLTGKEEGLVGYWSFDDGSAKDASRGKHDGTLTGTPQFVEEALPAEGSLRAVQIARLTGKVSGPGGTEANGYVILVAGGQTIARLTTDANGEYNANVVTGSGLLEVQVLRGNFGAGEPGILLHPGDDRRVDLVLQPTQLAGRVLAMDGKPLPGITVDLLQSKDDAEALGTLITDVQGAIDFGARPPGRYVLRAVTAGGPVLYEAGKALELNWGTVLTDIEFKLPDAAVAAGPAGASAGAGVRPANRILVLDGRDSYVQLPPDIIQGLEEVTVEGRVRWDEFRDFSRFFSFGEGDYRFVVQNQRTSNGLRSTLDLGRDEDGTYKSMDVFVPSTLTAGQWVHVAVVVTKSGMTLYLNGTLAGTLPEATLSLLKGHGENRLGASGRPGTTGSLRALCGAMDEVRVWKLARTEQQIRENLSKQLTGAEPGLIGLWNFDDPANPGRDAAPNGFHGKLNGSATTVLHDAPAKSGAQSFSKALQLKGGGNFLALPRSQFHGLETATVECWARWDTLNEQAHVFEFDAAKRIKVVNHARTADLTIMAVQMVGGSTDSVRRNDALTVGRWHHIAAVFGPDGMTLLQDGLLAGSAPYTGGLASTGVEGRQLIGSCTVNPESSFRGQIAEFRLWKSVRTAEQIRADMFKTLAGTEDGLAGLWNFRDPSQPGRDATPGGHHADVVGTVAVVDMDLPAGLVSGVLTSKTGQRLSGVEVVLTQGGNAVTQARSGADGGYVLSFAANALPYELKATLDTLGIIREGIEFKGGPKTLDLMLGDSLRISGTVTGPDDALRRGVKVEAVRAGDGVVAAQVLTDSTGAFAVRGVPDGSYQVRAAGPAGAVLLEGGREFAVLADAAPVTGAVLRLPAANAARVPEAANHVLTLDGTSGFVEIPPHVFDSLTAGTVEGWVNWATLLPSSRFFDFGGGDRQLYVSLRSPSGLMLHAENSRNRIEIDRGVNAGEWIHVAAVMGDGGMRLYLNGVLVGSRPEQVRFATAGSGGNNYLGLANPTAFFRGQMDEIRVWATQRTEAEIRDHLFSRLSGTEDGLAGLWNFDDPGNPGRDATVNGFHGMLRSRAQVTPGKVPLSAKEMTAWASLSGAVTDHDGRALRETTLRLERGTESIETKSDAGGHYRLAVPASLEPWRLTARTDEWSSAPMTAVLDQGEKFMEIRLRDSALLSGRVLALDDSPMPTVVVQAVPVAEDGKFPERQGLRAEFFRRERLSDFPALTGSEIPDLSRVDPVIDFTLKNDSIAGPNFSSRLYARWSGKIRVGTAGDYTVYLSANDAGRLWLDGRMVVSSSSIGALNSTLNSLEQSVLVNLSAGDHEILVEFFNGTGRDGCRLSWSREDLKKEVIPADVFFHQPAKTETVAVITDAKGKYRFPQLRPGRYSLRAHVPGGFAALADGRVVTVEEDKPLANPDFHLAPFKQGRWKHYSHLDGLTGGLVVCMLEAADGALWIGSQKGVSRFDGQNFFTLSGGALLPDSQVNAIAEEPAGVIWFATSTGLCRYEFHQPARKLTTFKKEDGLADDEVTALVKDRAGRLWIGTANGLSRFDPAAWNAGGKPFVSTYTKEIQMVKDSGPRAHHGRFMGEAALVDVRVPGFEEASAAANRGLQLDGRGSFVELPPNIFGGIESATVEAWVKWETLNNLSDVFDFGRDQQEMLVGNRGPSLQFKFNHEQAERRAFLGTELVRAGEWCHVAAVSGREGMKLYFNGALVGARDFQGSFAGIGNNDRNLLGRDTAHAGGGFSDFHGQMDELRVWKAARTAAQIRENMNRRLTGKEADLFALWSFDSTALSRDELPLTTGQITALYADTAGALWIGTPRGVSKFDGNSFIHFTKNDGLPGGVTAISEARDGTLWFGSTGSVLRLNPAGAGTAGGFGVLTNRDGLTDGAIGDIAADSRGGMWFATGGLTATPRLKGLSRYDGKSFVTFGMADGLGDRDNSGARSLLIDTHGGIWVGTARGVSHYDFQSLAHFGEAEGMDAGTVMDIASTQDGNAWFLTGTNSKLSRFDGQRLVKMTRDHGVTGSRLSRLYVDSDGSLLVSDWLTDVVRYDPSAAPREQPHFERIDSRSASAMVRASSGELWLAGDRGLWKLGESGLVEERVTNVSLTARGADGTLWFAGGEGVWRYAGTEFFQFTSKDGLPGNSISGMHALPDGSLLVTAASGGAAILNGERFVPWPAGLNRLGSVGCHDITRDADGHTWVATDEGVFRTDGTAWIMLNERDGLPENHVRRVYSAGDGHVWIGLRNNGAARYLPVKLTPRAPVLTVLTDRGQVAADEWSVTAGQRATFTFNAVEFYTPVEKRQYRWQLFHGTRDEKALAAGWAPPDTETQMEKSFDEPGAWTLAVQFIDRDLNYSPPALARLYVVLPWHANAKVMVPAGAGVAGLLGWAFLALSMYVRKRRESDRLREKLLKEEHAARQAAERARSEIETKNSQLEEARATADEASKAKSTFLANMSHELRTPMNAIIGYSEMLQEEAEDTGQSAFVPDLQKIHGAGKHLLSLINDILDLSKIEAGKMTLFVEDFDVAKMVGEVAATVQPLVAKHGNRLVVECPEDVGTMKADVTKVRQTLFNLLSNASKFTEKGTITLTVNPAIDTQSPSAISGSLRFSTIKFKVTDTGIGMTPGQLERLFQAFEQADASTTKKFGGTGLGLAISKKFCQLMGGDIAVESEPGTGTTFTVTLPAQVKDQSDKSDPTDRSNSPASAGHPTILIIDDDPAVRDLLHRHLTKENFHVLSAAHGAQGLTLAKEHKPAVITLDVMMPGMDGWAVLTALKADPATAGIPVIMMTIVDDKNMGFALGADDYFTKPIDWQRLAVALKKHGRSKGGQTVLVVEDDAATRDMLRRSMEREGWKVTEAANGRTGLEALESGGVPALILLDLMMPEMDGFTFMKELRARPDGRHVPVIVITAKDLTVEDRRRLNGEVARILQKGATSTEDFLAEIRSLLPARPASSNDSPIQL